MRNSRTLLILLLIMTISCNANTAKPVMTKHELADRILADTSLLTVQHMAEELLKKGSSAGSAYPQVWIRDMNTFIEASCDVSDRNEIRNNLLVFFHLQQENGEIVENWLPKQYLTGQELNVYTSSSDTRHAGFKGNAKSDQESSLIQAVGKYIKKTGDRSILDVSVDGRTVRKRMASAMEYLLKYRYSPKYGLITGATTQDWGDVQPEDNSGTYVTKDTHWSCEIYNNAMFILALDTMCKISDTAAESKAWEKKRAQFSINARKYLWDEKKNKFIPHIYLADSPFPSTFDESSMHYHGGTAVAIEAGLLTKEEIAIVNRQMLDNVERSGAPSIGLTIYPPYPKGFFKNKQTTVPYTYQNGGDWTWFGGRMIQQLVANGFPLEAYEEIQPMVNRVLKNKGFYEWYAIKRFDIRKSGFRWYGSLGKPNGSSEFRGEAGVLAKAIKMLREWAEQEILRSQNL